jgi:hypothetical protein
MSMHNGTPASRSPTRARISSALLRVLLTCMLGVGAALLVSCASSGKDLIPTGNAGPLQGDFEEVAHAAQNGNGSCATTKTAIAKTERDFGALPATVNSSLRRRLEEGISKLRTRALEVCAQPLPQATVTTTSPRTSPTTQSTSTTPTPTQTTPTQTTPTTSTPTTTGPGGVPAPGNEPSPGTGNEPGGAGAGEGAAGAGGGGSGGAKAGGGQEGGK